MNDNRVPALNVKLLEKWLLDSELTATKVSFTGLEKEKRGYKFHQEPQSHQVMLHHALKRNEWISLL